MSTKKLYPLAVLITLSSILSSCSSKKGNDAPSLSMNLPMESLQIGDCLSVEKLVSHFNQENFQAASRRITYDLHTGWRSDQFFIYNFGITHSPLSSFPFIKKASQTDCSLVSLETAYGRQLSYRITGYDKDSISLTRDTSLDPTEPVEALSKAQRTEPEIKSLKIHVESPTSLSLSIVATTLRAKCSSTKLYEYSKGMRLRWASSQNQFPPVETMDPNLVAAARRLIPQTPPVVEVPPTALLLTSNIAMAAENTEPPPAEEIPPVEETPPVEEAPPVAETPPVEESPPVTEPTPPETPAAPEVSPTTDQFSVQEIIDLQNRIRQLPLSNSCAT